MKSYALSLEGETFHINVDDEHPLVIGDNPGSEAGYPVTILHVSSTMKMDTSPAYSTAKADVLDSIDLMADLRAFYRRLYGQDAGTSIVILADPA
jgi:hypothetical protein